MTNILFDDRVRRKTKSFWSQLNPFYWYYEDERITFKEKVYTFFYNMQKTGLTTQGEMDWSFRMMSIDYSLWKELEQQFKNDYKEFEMSQQ